MRPVRWLFRLGLGRPSLTESVDWEIDHYLDEQTERLVAVGMDPDDARAEAERRFGDLARQRRRMRAVDRRAVVMKRQGDLLDSVTSAVRQSLRGIRRSPGLAAAVVLTLGLGIGVNAAMFGVVDRILLRAPEHVVRPEQVHRVFLDGDFFGRTTVTASTTYPDLADLRTIPEFESVGAVTASGAVTLGSGSTARQITRTKATHDFFTTLGVQAHVGRLFDAEDDRLESPLTAVVSYEFWQSSLGGDPDVLGSTLDLSGNPATVIGVAPRGFTGIDLDPVDVWLPAVPAQYAETGGDRFLDRRTYWWLQSIVRLRDRTGLESAEAQATALHVNSREEGRRDPNARIFLAPIIEARGPGASMESRVARWVAGVSLIVLLIACANVTNLLLARGAGRRREVAVRLALGVSRVRLLGETILDTLVLAGMGGLAALALAHWGGALVRGVLVPDVLWTSPPLDGRVLLATSILSLGAGLLAGLGPALQSVRTDLTRDLAEGGRGSTNGRSRAQGALTVAQAGLSVVLLVGAGLFLRSVMEIRRLDLGVDVDGLVQASLEFEGEEPDALEATRLYDEAMDAVSAVPGVESVAGTTMLFGWFAIEDITVPGLDSLPLPPGSGPFLYGVTPGYLRTVGLRVLRGRPILDTDRDGAPRVAVVDEHMAAALWPEQDALGRCVHIAESEECTTVVGVAEAATRGDLQSGSETAYYLPLAQMEEAPSGMFVRTEGDAREVAARLAQVLRSFGPRVRFAEVQTYRELLGPQTRGWTVGASLFTAFGALALLVAAIGLYSVLAFDVAARTKELGIRAALGAGRERVLRQVVAAGVRLAGIGILIGVATSVVTARYIQDLLFRVEGGDLVVLGTVGTLLVVVALLASAVPAFRATRVDPMTALRA